MRLTDQTAGGTDWGRYDDGAYLALGDLKGTNGNQNYPIPADTNPTGYTSVVIWVRPVQRGVRIGPGQAVTRTASRRVGEFFDG